MSRISRGFTFDNPYVEAADLHALVDTLISGGTAALVNVDSHSCDTGIRLFATATPSTVATGDLLVNDSGFIDYYSGAVWTAQTLNSISLTNDSGVTLPTGTPVVLVRSEAAATKCTIHGVAGNAPDPFGVTLSEINPGAAGLIAFRGKVPMKINNLSLNAGGKVVIFGGSVYSQAQAMHGYVPAAGQSEQSDVFAIALEPGNFGFGTQLVMLFK